MTNVPSTTSIEPAPPFDVPKLPGSKISRLEAIEGHIGLLLAGLRPIGHGQVPLLELLVRFGPFGEQRRVLRLRRDRLGVFGDGLIPFVVRRIQIADDGGGLRVGLEQASSAGWSRAMWYARGQPDPGIVESSMPANRRCHGRRWPGLH